MNDKLDSKKLTEIRSISVKYQSDPHTLRPPIVERRHSTRQVEKEAEPSTRWAIPNVWSESRADSGTSGGTSGDVLCNPIRVKQIDQKMDPFH